MLKGTEPIEIFEYYKVQSHLRKPFCHQVIEVDIEIFREKVKTQKQGLFFQCIMSYSKRKLTNNVNKNVVTSFEIQSRILFCKGCKIMMQRGKIPKMCSNNGLKVDEIPVNLILMEFENNLIEKNIIFQKLH